MAQVNRGDLVGAKSIFRLPISNTLGISAMESRAKLKTFALQEPAEYSKMRNEVYIGTLKAMVESSHNILWNLLAKGERPNGTTVAQIQIGSGASAQNWSPNLPDQEIGKIANGFAESMMHAFEDIMNKVLPDEYAKLADDKQMHIAKVQGLNLNP